MVSDIVVDVALLRVFTERAFEACGVARDDAQLAADVLVTADLRGVESHGVARLRHYLAHLRRGLIARETHLRIVRELPTTITVDAGNGLGLVAAPRAMQLCIERAAQYGSAAVAVRQSNHFGMAGYHAMLALPHDMIGVAMTNASPTVVPFGGVQPMLGTNPIAWAIPCGAEAPIVVDMSTSGVSYGKIELALRTGKQLPLGWALGEDGQPTSDAREASQRPRLLPLGGLAEGVGYKGYGLATVVEALCHALAGAAMSIHIVAVQGSGERPRNMGHFFAAYRVDGFRDVPVFKREMDELVRALRDCPPLEGSAGVLLPGEREARASAVRRREGIPLHAEVVTSLSEIATEYHIPPIME